jgi:hypothetical protein
MSDALIVDTGSHAAADFANTVCHDEVICWLASGASPEERPTTEHARIESSGRFVGR